MAKVLIADDNQDGGRALGSIITISCQCSLKIFLAFSGEEALEIFQKERPDVLILDYNMPKKNGLEVTKKLVEEKALGNTAVFIFSCSSPSDIWHEAEKLGVSHLIGIYKKIAELEEIVAAVKGVLAEADKNCRRQFS